MVLSKESKLHGILFYFTADGNVFYQNTLQYVVPKLSLLLNVISCATSDNAFVLFISLIAMSMLGPIIIQISEP